MKPLEKIWTIVQKIQDAIDINIPGDNIELSIKTLKIVDGADKILKKIAYEGHINIIYNPYESLLEQKLLYQFRQNFSEIKKDEPVFILSVNDTFDTYYQKIKKEYEEHAKHILKQQNREKTVQELYRYDSEEEQFYIQEFDIPIFNITGRRGKIINCLYQARRDNKYILAQDISKKINMKELTTKQIRTDIKEVNRRWKNHMSKNSMNGRNKLIDYKSIENVEKSPLKYHWNLD